MKRYIYTLCLLMVGAVLMTSCLSSDDDTNTEYYKDTAITAFSLTTVNQYIHTTTTAGKDSTYKKTLSSIPVFTIDQYQGKIYNTDSLPSGSDLSHLLASISSKNSGIIVINYPTSTGSDSLLYYSSSDSIDFSQPREIRVYSNDGTSYRSYTVTVNVHQSETGTLLWEKKQTADYPTDDNKARWEALAANAGMKQFIGAGTKEAYAFSNEGTLMVSKDEGQTWEQDLLDEDASLLPTANIAFLSFPFRYNLDTDYQMIVGTSEDDSNACTIWRKLAEYGERSMTSKWAYVALQSSNNYYLPKQEHISLAYFKGNILAVGSNGIIYVSYDQGITWKTKNGYTLPDGLTSYNISMKTDDQGSLWLINHDDNEVWRGYTIE
ncbi:MAG: hypothetical protein IJ159_06025 [Prevotella sp.]|nr:hypothetical protein [Prevotella sp.]